MRHSSIVGKVVPKIVAEIMDHQLRTMDEFIAARPFLQAFFTLVSTFCHLLCLYYAVKIPIDLVQGFRLYYMTRWCSRVNFVEKYGQWAVVSGSGDGIGRGMVVELARRGMSIVVMDRDEGKLAETRQILAEIAESGQVETIKADLSDWSDENLERISDQLKPDQRNIGVLINNVATLPYEMLPFVSFSEKSMKTMVNLNALSAALLTRMITPGMLARRRGLVMNVASLAATLPAPNMNLYGPTKAFVEALTHQLQFEFRSQPIKIVLLKPGPVLTSLADPTRTMKSSVFFPKFEDYAKSVIGALPAAPKMFTGSPVHGLMRVSMEIINMLGLFHLVTDAVASYHGRYCKNHPRAGAPDEQRTSGGDHKPKDSALLAAFSKPPEATRIDMHHEASTQA